MKYSLKTDNYKTQEIFKDNILPSRAYFIPFSDEKEYFASEAETERYSSSKVRVLNGEWDFKYYGAVSQMPDEFDTDKISFDKISVPSMWQFTGYEMPYYLNTRYPFEPNPPHFPTDCPIGVYRRKIDVADLSKNYILSFLGVAGSIDLFVNGKYIGYSEGSHNTAEFDITDTLISGSNEIIAVVHKWSNGVYLECQDMFRSNGIFRDVLLYTCENNYIYDFHAETPYNSDGTYNLNLNVKTVLNKKCALQVSLFYKNKVICSEEIKHCRKENRINFTSLSVKEWSAEIPNLYTLVLTLKNGDRTVETVGKKIGFKHIEIKGNVFYFNNKPIKLLGVNHHDTNPKTGYYMTVKDMEKDIKLFKQYNMNCVRTSHYPPDPVFLDLCDKYGIYVIDEVDIECHGVARIPELRGSVSHNSEWKVHFWDRVSRMYERDKNNPSVVMWSLGNESHGISNHDYCYRKLKKLTDIPIHYEGASRMYRWAYDVISQMYPDQSLVRKVADGKGAEDKFYNKPYFLCEYAHAMGVGAGSVEDYVSDFLRSDNMLGGCVWEFADHAVYHSKGKYKYTYGGDHGEEYHDRNFCVDGLFFPDRTPHAGALQIKNCYRPVRAKLIKISDNTAELEFKNINYFKAVSFTVRWEALDVLGKEKGEFRLNIAPQKTERITLDLERCYDAIVLKYCIGKREIASEQIDFRQTLKKISVDSSTVPTVRHSESNIIVSFNGGSIIFDTKKGQVISYTVDGKELINNYPCGNSVGFSLSVFRAPIDNDVKYFDIWAKLKLMTEYMSIDSTKPYTITDKSVIIENSYILSTVSVKSLLEAVISYEIFGDGTVKVKARCTDSKKVKYYPRFSLALEMPKEFENVKYFGLGDKVNAIDFREHAMLGEYSCKVSDMRERHIKPQEASMRSEVRYAEITDKYGSGLEFIAVEKPFTFSADHFTSAQCAKAAHREDLKDLDTTCLHIDSYLLGVGSASCGPETKAEYRKESLTDEELEVIVRPVRKE